MFGERAVVDFAKGPLDFTISGASNFKPLSILSGDLKIEDFTDSSEPPLVKTIQI